MSKEVNVVFDQYIAELTRKLGPHYRLWEYREKGWSGFIYCECYGGEGFHDMHTSANREKRLFYGVGAMARIELRRVILLDHRLGYAPDRSITNGRDGSSDSTVIDMAQPDFNEQFFKIKPLHDAIVEYFNPKNWVYGAK